MTQPRWTGKPINTRAKPVKHGPGVEALHRKVREAAMVHVRSVPYRVTLRWVFYRLLQDGVVKGKGAYKSVCEPILAEARHQFIDGWTPDTLADEGRDIQLNGEGYATDEDWVDQRVGELFPAGQPDYWHHQPCYLIVAFEAAAMVGQFDLYLPPFVSRCAFKGQDSIEHKSRLKDAIEDAAARYRKPVVVLYFGDDDESGWTIPQGVERDIRSWTDTPFEWVRAGLAEGQAAALGVSENPEKPGTYQWEALDDGLARTIIEEAVGEYVDDDGKEAAGEEGERREGAWRRWWMDNTPTASDLGLT